MNKKDFVKLALIGMASGVCLAAQSFDSLHKSEIAMNKCTKNSNQDRPINSCNGDDCESLDDCSGSSCGGKDSCNSGDTEESVSKYSASDKNGRNSTRELLYGEQSKMKSKRKRSGRFY